MPAPRPSRSPRPASGGRAESGSKTGRPTTGGSKAGRPAVPRRATAAKSEAPKRGSSGRPAAGSRGNYSSVRGESARSETPPRRGAGRPSTPSKGNNAGRRTGKPERGAAGNTPTKAGAKPAYKSRSGDFRTREELPKRKGWGSVTRRGAAALKAGDGEGSESKWDEERSARPPERGEDRGEWVIKRADVAPKRVTGKAVKEEPWKISPDAIKEIGERVPQKDVDKLAKSLKDAARAFAAERFGDARKAMRPLLNRVPDAPSVLELNGMIYYRAGRWEPALKELRLANEATGSYDLHPVMMDCLRALKRPKPLTAMWDDLRETSPSPEVMAEGRIVMAESLAERGNLEAAIELLEKGPRAKQRAQLYHLRSWYALGDLYDRAGNTPKARMFFEKVAAKEPDLADVLDRLAALD